MFEILLLIYLFPIMVIAMLLVKLAIWIVRNLFKFVLWLVRTLFVLLGKGLLLAFAFVVAKKPFNHPPDREGKTKLYPSSDDRYSFVNGKRIGFPLRY